jgi:hypothetical protein
MFQENPFDAATLELEPLPPSLLSNSLLANVSLMPKMSIQEFS